MFSCVFRAVTVLHFQLFCIFKVTFYCHRIPAFSRKHFHPVLSLYPPRQCASHVHIPSLNQLFSLSLSFSRMSSVVFLSSCSKHWMLKGNLSLVPQASERLADSKCPWQLTGVDKAPASSLALPQPTLPASAAPMAKPSKWAVLALFQGCFWGRQPPGCGNKYLLIL